MSDLELDRLVQRPALLAPGAVNIRVVGIDVTAFDAPKDAVVAGSRSESALPLLSVDSQASQANQQQHHVTKQDGVRRHDA